MVTIKDVADRSGVAISTVSKVLNGYPNVSEKTRQAVNDAIQELHYVPNAIAAALSSKTRIRIALVINSVEQSQSIDEMDMRYLSGALEEAKKQGLTVRPYFYSMLEDLTDDEIIGE
jgi:DNA-binding LacI/PurR family transcriptional regulator